MIQPGLVLKGLTQRTVPCASMEAEKSASVQAICEQMGRTPAWISGLVLRADGYECEYYKKD